VLLRRSGRGNLFRSFCQLAHNRLFLGRSIYHSSLSCDLKNFLHHILIDHSTEFSVCQTEGLQNIQSNFDHGHIRVIDLTAINFHIMFIDERVVIAIVAGLNRKDSV